MKQFELAFQDFCSAIRKYRIWWVLGVLDVRQRYQRSVLGPWWVSISMLVFIFTLGTVFSRLFHTDFTTYIPYFSAGYLLWLYISACLAESTELFKNNSGFIKQIGLPFSVYVFRFLSKNIIIFAHNFLVYLLIVVCFGIPVGWSVLLAIPGFLLVSINLYWMSLCIALLSTRFRDVVPILNSCIQILFLVTPISWDRTLLHEHSKILAWNPVIYLIDLVREPLLGKMTSLDSWMISSYIAVFGICITFFIFTKTRSRISFWVD